MTTAKTKTPKVSGIMLDALAMFVLNGGALTYWPGGFWTYEGCPARVSALGDVEHGIPAWHVTTHTIQALHKRGLVTLVNHVKHGYPIAGEVTPEGRKLIEPKTTEASEASKETP